MSTTTISVTTTTSSGCSNPSCLSDTAITLILVFTIAVIPVGIAIGAILFRRFACIKPARNPVPFPGDARNARFRRRDGQTRTVPLRPISETPSGRIYLVADDLPPRYSQIVFSVPTTLAPRFSAIENLPPPTYDEITITETPPITSRLDETPVKTANTENPVSFPASVSDSIFREKKHRRHYSSFPPAIIGERDVEKGLCDKRRQSFS